MEIPWIRPPSLSINVNTKFMKKIILSFLAAAALVVCSCKDGHKDGAVGNGDAQASAPAAGSASEPKSFTISFTPDTVILGKEKEVFIKIVNAKGIELQDPDGKDQGILFSFGLEVTNKNRVGGHSIFFRTDNFRLQLDNGNSITEDKGDAESIPAESTKQYKEITYKIPAGSKPKVLNLFHDETRVSVGVDLQ